MQVQSACFSPDGEVIVAGTVTGKWVVLDSRTRELHGLHQDTGAEPITTVSFSPDGHKLALSSRAAIQARSICFSSVPIFLDAVASQVSAPVTH